MKERTRIFVANSSGCVQMISAKALEGHLAAKAEKFPPTPKSTPGSFNDIITDPRGGSLEDLFMGIFQERSK